MLTLKQPEFWRAAEPIFGHELDQSKIEEIGYDYELAGRHCCPARLPASALLVVTRSSVTLMTLSLAAAASWWTVPSCCWHPASANTARRPPGRRTEIPRQPPRRERPRAGLPGPKPMVLMSPEVAWTTRPTEVSNVVGVHQVASAWLVGDTSSWTEVMSITNSLEELRSRITSTSTASRSFPENRRFVSVLRGPLPLDLVNAWGARRCQGL